MLPTNFIRSGFAALFLANYLLMPVAAFAQENEAMLVLEPHCTAADRQSCPQFETLDATHLKTSRLNPGDILDIDVVLLNGTGKDIQTVHSWLTYDPNLLEGRSVTLNDIFSAPSPGEQNIEKEIGTVKIGGAVNTVDNGRIAIARVTFRVIATTEDTVIGFQGFNSDGTGKTSVNGKYQTLGSDSSTGLPLPPCTDTSIVGCRGVPTPLLLTEPSKLSVTLTDPAQDSPVETVHPADSTGSPVSGSPLTGAVTTPSDASSSAPESTPAPVLAGAGSSAPSGSSTFTLLQVQNLRVTTRDTQIFLGWDPLSSTELGGYNIYYGTVSGRYIQRRSIPSTASSLVLRDLQPDVTYFLAVRAVNLSGQESIFSQEVSVTVGKQETSSSPLLATETTQLPPENTITSHGGTGVTGTTGVSDNVFIFAFVSACIGTAFAFARHGVRERRDPPHPLNKFSNVA